MFYLLRLRKTKIQMTDVVKLVLKYEKIWFLKRLNVEKVNPGVPSVSVEDSMMTTIFHIGNENSLIKIC